MMPPPPIDRHASVGATRTHRRKPKDPEPLALWRKKFGPMMKILGPFLILFGLVEVVRHL
jgi:hypothetical protein